MSDEISSREGGTPEQLNPMRRRRIRKLSGVERQAIGDLAYEVWSAAQAARNNDEFRLMLARGMASWRARYL